MPVLNPKRASSIMLTSIIFNPLLLKGLPPKNNINPPITKPNIPIREAKAIRKSNPAKTSEKYDATSITDQ